MLSWSLTFFILALIAGLFGFFNISAAMVGIAKVLFFLFLILFVIALIFGRRRPPAV